MQHILTKKIYFLPFRNMQLKKIKRAEKKGTESVMDEKFSLLFYTTVVFNEFKISVSTIISKLFH